MEQIWSHPEQSKTVIIFYLYFIICCAFLGPLEHMPIPIKLRIASSLNISKWRLTSHQHSYKYNYIKIQAIILSANQWVDGIYLAGIYLHHMGDLWKTRQMVRLIVWAGFHFSAFSDLIFYLRIMCNHHKWVFQWNRHVTKIKSWKHANFRSHCVAPMHVFVFCL